MIKLVTPPPQAEEVKKEDVAATTTAAPVTSAAAPPPPQSAKPQSSLRDMKMDDAKHKAAQLAHVAAERTHEAADKVKEKSVFGIILLFANLFEYRMAIFIGVVCLALLSFGAKVGVEYYVGDLFNRAVAEIRQEDYDDAIAHLNRYINFHEERNVEAERWLARALVFKGKSNQIDSLLRGTGHTNPETNYIRALANLPNSPSDASRILRLPQDTQSYEKLGKSHPYMFAADGIFKLLIGDYAGAVKPLNVAADNIGNLTGEKAFIASNYMRALYPAFTLRQNLKIASNLSVALTISPTDNPALVKQLGFAPDLASFINHYDIPFRHISSDLESVSAIADEYRALALLAQTQSNTNITDIISDTFSTGAPKTLLAKYIAGYYYAINGDYAQAAEFYRNINQQQGSAKSYIYEATATWLGQENSTIPDEQVINAYKRAINLNSTDIHALNNYALMEAYRGNIEEAARIIQPAIVGNSSFSAYTHINHALIVGILQKSADVDSEIKLMEKVLEENPDISLAYNVMAELYLLKGDFLEAATFLNKNLALQPDNSAIPLKIANIYRLNGRLFLSISALTDAYRKFPDNDNIVRAFIADKARIRKRKELESLLQKHRFAQSSQEWLYAQALMIFNNPGEAALLADRALQAADDDAQKIDIAFDSARFHLIAGDAEPARAAWNIAETLIENTINNKNYPLILRAIDLWINAVDSGGADATKINELLVEAEAQHNNFAKIDLYLALTNVGQGEEAVSKLELASLEATGYSARLLQAINIAHTTLGNTEKAESVAKKIKNLESESESVNEQEELLTRDNKVFSSHIVDNEILLKIDEALKVDNYKKAIDLYTQLIKEENIDELFETPALSFQNRGALYVSVKEYKKAADDFRTALSMKDERMTHKQEVAINYNLANTLIYDQDFKNAEPLLKRLLENELHTEHNHVYLRMLAHAVNRMGRAEEAKDIYQQLIDNYPPEDIGIISVYFAIANIARVQSDYTLVVKTLNHAIEVDPNNVKIHRALVSAYKQLGDIESAYIHEQIIKDLSK